MLEFRTKNGIGRIRMGGNVEIICADLFMVMHEMYDGIRNDHSEEAAKEFKNTIINNIDKAFMSEEELEEKVFELKDINKTIEGLKDALQDLLEDMERDERKRKPN